MRATDNPRIAVERRAGLPRNEPLSRSYSLYLDALRFLAALAVFLDHLTSFPITGEHDRERHGLLLIGNYGQTAVTIFFVLSGYIIAYVYESRENRPRIFTISRVSRLYSVVLPALAVTFLFDFAGQRLNPAFYEIPKILAKPPSVAGYLSSALFVNEYRVFGFGGIAPGSNAPFWSLSFEATYYVVAGLLLFRRRRIALPIAGALLLLAGPTIAVLAPVWALGFAAYRYGVPVIKGRATPLFLWAASGLLILLVPLLLQPIYGDILGLSFPWGRGQLERDLGKDYATAIAVSVHLVAGRLLFAHWPHLLDVARKPLRFLGATTFPLYAMHFPAIAFAAAISPFDRGRPIHVVWLCIFVGTVIAVATPFCERFKIAIRDLFSRSPSAPATAENASAGVAVPVRSHGVADDAHHKDLRAPPAGNP